MRIDLETVAIVVVPALVQLAVLVAIVVYALSQIAIGDFGVR